jgi:hypothetical protein
VLSLRAPRRLQKATHPIELDLELVTPADGVIRPAKGDECHRERGDDENKQKNHPAHPLMCDKSEPGQ